LPTARRLLARRLLNACRRGGGPVKGRDCAIASVAGKLFSDSRVPLDNVWPMLLEFNRELCQPPKAETDVRRIWKSLKKKAISDRFEAAEALIAATGATQAALQEAVKGLADLAGIAAERCRARVDHYQPLIERILAQSERRVLGAPEPPLFCLARWLKNSDD
jgi:primase-like protein